MKVKQILALLLTLVMLLGGVSAAPVAVNDDVTQGEVLAAADSMQHALEIAAGYRLNLKSYAYGIAVLAAPDPERAIARSNATAIMRNGKPLPKLHHNHIYTTYNWNSDDTLQWHHDEMSNVQAWDISTGKGVVVAIIDTGIDINHPDFAGRILPNSYDSHNDKIGLAYADDDEGHGTHVSGITAGANNNNLYSGVAPESKILAIKANEPSHGWFYGDSLLRGINYAVENGADIINMSLGRGFEGGYDELEHETIQNAVKKGVLVICAAGNASDSNAGYPAAYPESIAVSSTRYGYEFENYYSNFGPQIDIAAPGSDILAPVMGGDYGYMSGTSMAAPNVAGKAALIKSLNPDYTVEQLRDALLFTAADAGDAGWDEYFGYGIANSYAGVLGINALHKITYNFNCGVRAAATAYVVPNSKPRTPYNPLRDDYAFSGWYTTALGTGDRFSFSNAITADVTLFATWAEIKEGMYAAEFPDNRFRRAVLQELDRLDNKHRIDADMITMTDDFKLIDDIYVLDVSNSNIKDMTGLKHFTGLQYLYCGNNKITGLDLSNNHLLAVIHAWGNQLTEIDFSNNPEMLEIMVNSNSLEKLDLSNMLRLYYLECSYNELTELNISNTPSLSFLSFSENMIEAIDVSKSPELSFIAATNNLLTEIDLSNNPNLGYIGLCLNYLTELDVSNKPLLEELFCTFNYLRSVNVTGNKNLKLISVTHNNLTRGVEIIGLNAIRNNLEYFMFHPQRNDFATCAQCNMCNDNNFFKLGYIRGTVKLSVSDSLEILKNLVGIPNLIEKCGYARTAALIVVDRPKAYEPTVADALEILKALVGMDSIVERIDEPVYG